MNVRIVVAASLWLAYSGAADAGSVSAPPPPTTAPTGTSTQGVLAQVSSLSNQLRSQSDVVTAVQEELRALLAQRPRPPAEGASDDARKAYQQKLAEWNSRVDALKAQLEAAIAKLDDIAKRLEAAAAGIPAAMARDAEAARKAAAGARDAAEKTLAEATRLRSPELPPRKSPAPNPQPAPAPTPPG